MFRPKLWFINILMILILVVVLFENGCTGFDSVSGGKIVEDSQNLINQENYDNEGSNKKLRLVMGRYVNGLLNEIFGAVAQPITKQFVDGKYAEFGGSCDRYGSVKDCPANLSQSAVIPSALTSRSSILTRACEKILQNDLAVTTALSKIGINGTALPSPNVTSIQAAYGLFYPGRTVNSGDVTSKLLAISDRAKELSEPPMEAWRFLLLTLCLSPDWQLP